MSDPLSEVMAAAYKGTPTGPLFHYTSLEAVLHIVPSRQLWASDVRFMNDASELTDAHQILAAELLALREGGGCSIEICEAISAWLGKVFTDGPFIYATSFSEEGNLLSQWRGYTPHGRGVSLGFTYNTLAAVAKQGSFRFGRCIYDRKKKQALARLGLRRIAEYLDGAEPRTSQAGGNRYSRHFEAWLLSHSMISLAALMKHEAFAEEREWRLISEPIDPRYNTKGSQFRTGRTTLIPYVPLPLGISGKKGIELHTVYLGPTQNTAISLTSLTSFLGQHDSLPRRGVTVSLLPYRET